MNKETRAYIRGFNRGLFIGLDLERREDNQGNVEGLLGVDGYAMYLTRMFQDQYSRPDTTTLGGEPFISTPEHSDSFVPVGDLLTAQQRVALLTLENRWLGHLGTCYQCFHYAYGGTLAHLESRCEDGEARYQEYITAEKDRMKEGVAHEIHPVP